MTIKECNLAIKNLEFRLHTLLARKKYDRPLSARDAPRKKRIKKPAAASAPAVPLVPLVPDMDQFRKYLAKRKPVN